MTSLRTDILRALARLLPQAGFPSLEKLLSMSREEIDKLSHPYLVGKIRKHWITIPDSMPQEERQYIENLTTVQDHLWQQRQDVKKQDKKAKESIIYEGEIPVNKYLWIIFYKYGENYVGNNKKGKPTITINAYPTKAAWNDAEYHYMRLRGNNSVPKAIQKWQLPKNETKEHFTEYTKEQGITAYNLGEVVKPSQIKVIWKDH